MRKNKLWGKENYREIRLSLKRLVCMCLGVRSISQCTKQHQNNLKFAFTQSKSFKKCQCQGMAWRNITVISINLLIPLSLICITDAFSVLCKVFLQMQVPTNSFCAPPHEATTWATSMYKLWSCHKIQRTQMESVIYQGPSITCTS